ncbi:MAG TPA: magnesium transporter [Acidobacteriota bacterium]|nr:magnesium transporter [Acidobacteriota bacterium]
MSHAGISKSFWGMLKETSLAYFFDIGGLLAGFMVASQLGIFLISPWAIAVYPAILSAKGVIGGLLSGRLSTALHLGTIHPRFFKNTPSFYKLFEALIVITLATSITMSSIAIVFGSLFWGITFADFPAILSVVMATMAIGLLLSLITIKVAFVSFKRGLDPDIVVYPIMSTVADIFITLFYIAVISLFFSSYLGSWIIAAIALAFGFLILYILPKNIHDVDFIKTVKESMTTMLLVAFVVNVTGTVLKQISYFVDRKEIFTVYPALIDTIGDVGSVVGSTATTKLALGLLTPSLASMRSHAKNIFSAWSASLMVFVILAVLSLAINGVFSLPSFLSLISVLLITNVIAVTAIVLLSYSISILTFKKGLDPDNFVIPIESSFADSVTSIALLVALLLIG